MRTDRHDEANGRCPQFCCERAQKLTIYLSNNVPTRFKQLRFWRIQYFMSYIYRLQKPPTENKITSDNT
jgi:hypothetical protein